MKLPCFMLRGQKRAGVGEIYVVEFHGQMGCMR